MFFKIATGILCLITWMLLFLTSQVRRVLPDWLSKPTVIEQSYKDLKPVKEMQCLDEDILDLLQKNGIHSFFPGL
jgi:hypothetical protein